jgi:membrane protease YdiL (CAAX protease family)
MAIFVHPRNNAGWVAAAAYLLAYAGSLWALSRFPGFTLAEPLFSLATLAIAFPLLALALTRRARGETRPIARPAAELTGMLGYLAVFAVAVLGFGFSAINTAWPHDPGQSIVKMVAKLLTMVALPVLLLRALGSPIGETLALRWDWRRHGRALAGIGLALLAFQCVFGRGLQTLQALHPGISTLAWVVPAAFVWLLFEAGLCEEVLFRVGLQTRLAAALNSEFAAICLASLLFGLAHSPGLYLRGAALMEGADAHPTLLWSVAYSIAIISPAGFLFGVLWSRTRSLALIVLLHAITDLLPGLAPFIQTWNGG